MLNVLRQKANSWFMILLFAIITIVFIFTFGSWGGGNVSGEMPIAAEVNGHVISQAQFNAVYSNRFRRAQSYQPGYDTEQAQKDKMREKILDSLIGRELLAQAASGKGMTVDDSEVINLIKTQFFGPNQAFDRDLYRDRIVSGIYQTTEAQFEKQIRRDILASRMEQLLEESQVIPESALRREYNQRHDRISLKALRIDPSYFQDAPKSTEEQQTKWAAENGPAVEAYFNEYRPRFQVEKQVRARHILTKADQTAESKKAARAKAEAALKRVNAGEKFEDVAKDVSEDGSASRGGDLGFFAKEKMVKSFSDSAFSMKVGEVSQLVESPFGFHVIKVEEIQESKMKELDEVKVEIAAELMKGAWQKEQTMTMAKKAINDLKAGVEPEKLALANFDGDLLAKKTPNDPSIVDTSWIAKNARYVSGVGISPEFVTKAFSLNADKPVGDEPIEVSGRFYVTKMVQRELPDEKKFGEEKESIRTSLLTRQKQRVVQQFIEDIKETASIKKNDVLFTYAQ
jgi:peptidyl-prolyl cis-trans isomerase D